MISLKDDGSIVLRNSVMTVYLYDSNPISYNTREDVHLLAMPRGISNCGHFCAHSPNLCCTCWKLPTACKVCIKRKMP